MREVVTVHVGQAGLGMGSSWWELLCLEHGIQPNGLLLPNLRAHEDSLSSVCESFFMDTGGGRHYPRALLVDLEPTVCDEVRKGPIRDLFHSSNIISGMEDSADNFARGYYSIGREVIDLSQDYLRRITERCSSLQGFFLFHATGGGTGSGLGALILERMAVDYANKMKFTFTVNPSRQIGNSVTEPYNSVLSTHSLLEHTDVSFNIDNESLYDIVTKSLKISFPSYRNLNRVLAQVVSSVTSSLRFKESALNLDMRDLLTNMVPYPRIHTLITCYSPLIGYDNVNFDNPSVSELTYQLFQNNFLSCNQNHGHYLACCLMYRGEVTPQDVYQAVSHIKHSKNIKFVDWVPTGFKCGITSRPPATLWEGEMAPMSRSCCMIANNTCVVEAMARIHHKFDLMFSKRAFIHWYTSEGMEEGEFHEAREDLAALELDYEALSNEVHYAPEDDQEIVDKTPAVHKEERLPSGVVSKPQEVPASSLKAPRYVEQAVDYSHVTSSVEDREEGSHLDDIEQVFHHKQHRPEHPVEMDRGGSIEENRSL